MTLLLELLEDQAQTPFFNRDLDAYLFDLISAIKEISINFNKIQPEASLAICKDIWRATKYITGSSSNRIPYELVYALNLALSDWCKEKFIITTALIEDIDFHFSWVSPGKCINHYFPSKKITAEIIHIAFPRIYRHRPLYNLPLYHELGHFVDRHLGVTSSSLLISPVPPQMKEIEARHRSEHFSDLFAASYTGKAISDFLAKLFPDDPTTHTHPSTQLRLRVIDAFLNGNDHPVITTIVDTLHKLGLPELKKRYSEPALSTPFNDIRPYTISSDAEVHGLMAYGWEFLNDAQLAQGSPWTQVGPDRIEKIVNNLVEKSIRNKMIVDKWNHGTSM